MEAKSNDRTAVKWYAYNTIQKGGGGAGVKIEKRKITIQRKEEEEDHITKKKKKKKRKKKKRSFVCRRALCEFCEPTNKVSVLL